MLSRSDSLARTLAPSLFAACLTTSFLGAQAAHADRYWDVPTAAAATISARVAGQVVVEYCENCDGIFAASRILSARGVTATGPYADGDQVVVVRGAALLGVLGANGELADAQCLPSGGPAQNQALDKRGFTPDRLDIPYGYVLEKGAPVWVGEGVVDGHGTIRSLPLSAAVKAKMSECIAAEFAGPKKPRPASDFVFSTLEAFEKQTASVDIDGDGKKDEITWALVPGTLVRDVLPPRAPKITVRYVEVRLKKTSELLLRQALPVDVDAEGPTGDLTGIRAGVVFEQRSSKTSPGGFGVLVSTPTVDDFSFVEVSREKKRTKARLHWLGQFPRQWGAAFGVENGQPALKGVATSGKTVVAGFDPKIRRFTSKTLRWANGDEINVRAHQSAKAKKVGHIDLGDVTDFDDSSNSYEWTRFALKDGVVGAVASRFVENTAPMFDVSAGAKDGRGVRRRVTVLEVKHVSLTESDLEKMRAFGNKVRNARTAKAVCPLLTEGDLLAGTLSNRYFNKLFEEGDNDGLGFDISMRLETESEALKFIIFSEGTYVALHTRQLSSRLPKNAPERKVLQAVDALGAGANLSPIWIERRHDFGGCAYPKRAIPSLKWLKSSLAKSTPCLRDALKKQLEARLDSLSKEICFCDSKAKALKDVDATAKVLASLTALDGPALAESWRKAAAAAPAEKFSSDCVP